MKIVAGKFGQVIMLNDEIAITVLNLDDERVELGFEVPETVSIVSRALPVNQQGQETQQVNSKSQSVPVFEPGSTPHLAFGKSVLNADVDWMQLVTELVAKHVSRAEIANFIGAQAECIEQVCQQDYACLTFRAGARLVTLHCEYYPEQYGFN